MSKFRVVDEVKQKVLAFLLQNAEDLLVTSGCPIKKVNKHAISFRQKFELSDIQISAVLMVVVSICTLMNSASVDLIGRML